MKITPAILVQKRAELDQQLRQIGRSAEWVQIDIVDRTYSKKPTISIHELATAATKARIEAHLMIDQPEQVVTGDIATNVDRIIGHIESIRDPDAFIGLKKKHNVELGVAVNPDTPIEQLRPYIDQVQYVLIMSVMPGKQGQAFQKTTYRRIQKVKKLCPGCTIAIDGGVKKRHLAKLKRRGVHMVAMGSAIMGATNPVQQLKKLQHYANASSKKRTALQWVLGILVATSCIVGAILAYPYALKLYFAARLQAPLETSYELRDGKLHGDIAIPEENRLVIPAIHVDAEIIEGQDVAILDQYEGVWREPHTTSGSEPGNMVLAGHRFQYVPPNTTTFYNLHKLTAGDQMIIFWDKQPYVYEVYETGIVQPENIEIRNATNPDEYELTLYTCNPLGSTAERLVVKSRRIDDNTDTQQNIVNDNHTAS